MSPVLADIVEDPVVDIQTHFRPKKVQANTLIRRLSKGHFCSKQENDETKRGLRVDPDFESGSVCRLNFQKQVQVRTEISTPCQDLNLPFAIKIQTKCDVASSYSVWNLIAKDKFRS